MSTESFENILIGTWTTSYIQEYTTPVLNDRFGRSTPSFLLQISIPIFSYICLLYNYVLFSISQIKYILLHFCYIIMLFSPHRRLTFNIFYNRHGGDKKHRDMNPSVCRTQLLNLQCKQCGPHPISACTLTSIWCISNCSI
jgi:hypothetical protein